MLDPKTAMHLRQLFTAAAGTYPRLTGTADIFFTSKDGSKYKVETKTPAAAAAHLRHIRENDGEGIFERGNNWGVEPLYLRMHKVTRSPTLQKEWQTQAFLFAFRDLNQPSFMWLSHPQTTDYAWQGDEKVENMAPIMGDGPSLPEIIDAFTRAGDNWRDVNFLPKRATRLNHPHLTLVTNS